MPDTVLVTGGTAGIGFHTAAALTARGCHVFITGRDAERGARAASTLGAEFLPADHATVAGNLDLARRLTDRVDRLDVLINNVGGTGPATRETTVEGHGWALALNFVGPAVLTTALLPIVARRVVTVTSGAHRMWRGDPFADPGPEPGRPEREYVAVDAYAHAKLLGLMWTFALARRLAGAGRVANATNPGMAWTPGTAGLTPAQVPQWRLIFPVVTWLRRRASAEKAARAPVFLAAAPEAARLNGAYVEGDGRLRQPAPAARRLVDQERAWALAERLAAKVNRAAG